MLTVGDVTWFSSACVVTVDGQAEARIQISHPIPPSHDNTQTSLPVWGSSLESSATQPNFGPTVTSGHLPENKTQCWEGVGIREGGVWARRHSQCEPQG